MEKLNFSIQIHAPRNTVWDILWGKESYRAWTSVFAEGSDVETDWEEGSKVIFGDGKGSGMVSMIASKKPNEYMAFKHLGMMKDGVEDTTSEEVKQWAGVMETYTLQEKNGITTLSVQMDTSDDFKDYFSKTWPLALDKLKSMSEN